MATGKVSDSLGALLGEKEKVDVVVLAKGNALDVYTYVFLIEAYFKDRKIQYNQETANSLTATLTREQVYELSKEPSVDYIDKC